MKKIAISDFSSLVRVYFFVSIFLGIIIPPNIDELFPGIFNGVNEILLFIPGIKNIAQYSKNQGYIKMYYIIQWAIFPLLCYFLFDVMSSKNVNSKTTKRLVDSISIIIYSVLFLALSMVMIYVLGFHYKEVAGGLVGSGRVSALLYLLSTKYFVAVASPAIFLAIGVLLIASVLMIKNSLFIKKGK
ncbi:MAG: hypothetical protein M9929_00560 [Burkholderiaceae bacterium]|nr:hypothetical protein [Burkholderiaceae bacterium]